MERYARALMLLAVSALLAFAVAGGFGRPAANAQKKDDLTKFDGTPIENYQRCKIPDPTKCPNPKGAWTVDEKKGNEEGVKLQALTQGEGKSKKLRCALESIDCGTKEQKGSCRPFKRDTSEKKNPQWKITNEGNGLQPFPPEANDKIQYACICVDR